MNSSSLDALDRAILYHLQANARESITNIADDLDVADNTVRNRLQDLEDENVIEGYHASVNYDLAGVQHHYYFECTASVSERGRLAEEARRHEGVVEVTTLMTGNRNVLVIGAGSQKDDMTRLASELDELGLAIEREHLIRDGTTHPYSGFRLEHQG